MDLNAYTPYAAGNSGSLLDHEVRDEGMGISLSESAFLRRPTRTFTSPGVSREKI